MNKVGSTFKIEKLEDGTLTLSEISIEENGEELEND
jgi:hypothetical protein